MQRNWASPAGLQHGPRQDRARRSSREGAARAAWLFPAMRWDQPNQNCWKSFGKVGWAPSAKEKHTHPGGCAEQLGGQPHHKNALRGHRIMARGRLWSEVLHRGANGPSLRQWQGLCRGPSPRLSNKAWDCALAVGPGLGQSLNHRPSPGSRPGPSPGPRPGPSPGPRPSPRPRRLARPRQMSRRQVCQHRLASMMTLC